MFNKKIKEYFYLLHLLLIVVILLCHGNIATRTWSKRDGYNGIHCNVSGIGQKGKLSIVRCRIVLVRVTATVCRLSVCQSQSYLGNINQLKKECSAGL